MYKHLQKADSKEDIEQNQKGFITLIICLLLILVTVLVFAYLRVAKAHL